MRKKKAGINNPLNFGKKMKAASWQLSKYGFASDLTWLRPTDDDVHSPPLGSVPFLSTRIIKNTVKGEVSNEILLYIILMDIS